MPNNDWNALSQRHKNPVLLVLPFLILMLSLFSDFSHAATTVQAPSQDNNQQKASYAALADILQDDKSRAELIAHLRAAAGESSNSEQTATQSTTGNSAEKEAEIPSLSDKLADVSQSYASMVMQKVQTLKKTIDSGPRQTFDADRFFHASGYFILTVFVTFALFHLVRMLIGPLYKRLGHWGHHARLKQARWYQLPASIISAFAIDIAILLLTVAAGNLFTQYVNGGSALIARQQALFLSAFAVIEFFKAVLRLLFAPNFDYLRPFPLSDKTASYWNTRLAWVSGLIGYGLMVVVPIVATQINYPTAAIVNFVVMLALTLYASWLILHNRKNIRDEFNRLAQNSLAFFSIILRTLGHIWHILAVTYFVVLFFLSQFDFADSLTFMMASTVKSLAVIVLGAVISGLLSRWILKRITLPEDINRRYPHLQKRINSYIPGGLKVLRVLVVLTVTLSLLDAWKIFNLHQWLITESGSKVVSSIAHILFILFLSVVSWTLLASIIEHRLALEMSNGNRPSARERTLLTLFRNVLAIVICTITIMIILSQIGLNIAPLLAGAGALGLAISFGAQTLVKDVITGVFIQFENGMNTGEYVTAMGITGTVEQMTIRSIGLRDIYGVYHIVPYSSITTLSNYEREFGVYRAAYTVSRDEDIDHVNTILTEAVQALWQDENVRGSLLGEPTYQGVVALADQSFTVRVLIRTKALEQWNVQYALDRLVKIHFEKAGITMPKQAMKLYGEDGPHRPKPDVSALES
ncbi:mechanosensitive channel protein [Rouxiella sp. Mn2063]|uniref:mechanosensitive channel protein n=1 Tax=Rouxiella sp. Mn2063 TaxID=3395262 RepID=UPI003BE78771